MVVTGTAVVVADCNVVVVLPDDERTAVVVAVTGTETGDVTTDVAGDDAIVVCVEAAVVVEGATVVAGAVVVVVTGASTIERVREVESSSRNWCVRPSAVSVHVPVDTAVSAPVEALTVQTDVVEEEYVTPWPAGSVDPETTGNVVTPDRCNGVEPYDQEVGVLSDCDA